MIFAKITIGIFRRWQAEKKVVALILRSHGEHSEAVVLRDDSGSAYQITLHAAGLYFRPSLTVGEYLPDTMRVMHKYSVFVSVFGLRRALDHALEMTSKWMAENHATRLPQDEEMKLVRVMFERGGRPNQSIQDNAGKEPLQDAESGDRRV